MIPNSQYHAVRCLNAPELCGCGFLIKIGSGLTAVKEVSCNHHQIWLRSIDSLHDFCQMICPIVDAQMDIAEQDHTIGLPAFPDCNGITDRNDRVGMYNPIKNNQKRADKSQREPNRVPRTGWCDLLHSKC